jgi:hypothetical protein
LIFFSPSVDFINFSHFGGVKRLMLYIIKVGKKNPLFPSLFVKSFFISKLISNSLTSLINLSLGFLPNYKVPPLKHGNLLLFLFLYCWVKLDKSCPILGQVYVMGFVVEWSQLMYIQLSYPLKRSCAPKMATKRGVG